MSLRVSACLLLCLWWSGHGRVRFLGLARDLHLARQGYLTKDELVLLLSSQGESMSAEEIEEMMVAALDADKGVIYYEDYVQLLNADDF
jgi:hypothetical protein